MFEKKGDFDLRSLGVAPFTISASIMAAEKPGIYSFLGRDENLFISCICHRYPFRSLRMLKATMFKVVWDFSPWAKNSRDFMQT
jgi:hypothetical protein